MPRRTVTVSISDDDLAWIARRGNRSEYVRRLIQADREGQRPTETAPEAEIVGNLPTEAASLDWRQSWPAS